MLWVEIHDSTVVMRLEGPFGGTTADKARLLLARCRVPFELVVDLSEVSLVDAVGEEVLSWMSLIGGEFIARSWYSLNLCERLHLPLTGKFSQAQTEAAPVPEEHVGQPAFGHALSN